MTWCVITRFPCYLRRIELSLPMLVLSYVASLQILPTSKRDYVQVAFPPSAHLMKTNPWHKSPTKQTTPNNKPVESWKYLYPSKKIPTSNHQLNPGPAEVLTEWLATRTVRGHAPIYCHNVNPRAYYSPARSEKTKLHLDPLNCRGMDIDGVKVKIPIETMQRIKQA